VRVDNAVLRHLNPPASQGGSKKHLELKFSGIDFGAITIGCGVSQVGIALITLGQRPALSVAEFSCCLPLIADAGAAVLATIKQEYAMGRA